MLNSIRKFLINIKMWMSRVMSWIALFNAGMILFMFLSTLENYGVNINLTRYGLLIFVGMLFFVILLGYLEVRFGFLKEEIDFQQKRNPQIQEILREQREIKKLLKGGKK